MQLQLPSKHDGFWQHVRRGTPNQCWPWVARFNHDGYGQFSERVRRGPKGQRTIRASRRAYELTHGKIPLGKEVMHDCDNPACCNPAHLLLGTHRDNILDAVRKGRHRVGGQRLTREDAVTIRDLCMRGSAQKDVARMFGIARSTVSHIVAYRRHPYGRHLCDAVAARLKQSQPSPAGVS